MQRSAVVAAVVLSVGTSFPVASQNLSADLATQIAAAGHLRITTATAYGDLFQARVTVGGDSIGYGRGDAVDRRSGRRRDLPQPLPVAEVSRIELQNGSHAGTGALIGGSVGLAFGMVMIVAFANDEFFSEGMSTGDYVALGAIPTAGGALLGTLIGAAVPRWKTVYPAEPGTLR
ncbi:MAG TPA: hypothetical protein VMH88_01135 [Gemmatimonadales bacterium]|nr:hypothetical protein [Gemmatimonadales bacterium]